MSAEPKAGTRRPSSVDTHRPHYVPPPPPSWLPFLLVFGALAVGLAVAYDVGWADPPSQDVAAEHLASMEQPVDEPSTSLPSTEDDTAEEIDVVDTVEAPSEQETAEPETATSSGWGSVDGLLTFRGNPERRFHGRGPVPEDPEVVWSSEIGCSTSYVGSEPKEWCGTGWTGQPLVFPRDGRWWVAVGGYNRAVNFFDTETGTSPYPRFETGDIIKGTATIDPDGFPLLYTGSRDNFLHVVAIDGPEPRELWRLSADSPNPTMWNNDWDGSPIIIDDRMIVGGENSRFYVVKLNRGYGADGRVTVDPEIVLDVAGWDDEVLAATGDRQMSIENSVAVHDSVAYFANSGGLVQGWDLAALDRGGQPQRVFRYWVGDDTDATIVVGDDGSLYVGVEYERGLTRARELGQVFRLDPKADDPLVWSVEANTGLDSGVWATPALWNDIVIIATDDGRVIGLDQASGATRWTLPFEGPVWSSPVVVDDVLVQGDCTIGVQAFDLADLDAEGAPSPLWSVPLEGCVESTPAVWDGRIYVGTRAGTFYAIADR